MPIPRSVSRSALQMTVTVHSRFQVVEAPSALCAQFPSALNDAGSEAVRVALATDGVKDGARLTAQLLARRW